MNTHQDDVSVLELSLHGELVGYLAGFQNGRNVLSFAESFSANPARPTLSLITHPKFPNAEKAMAQPWVKNQRLHPTLSNLLPEGVLRELIAQGLGVHSDNEFQIFALLGRDLPGALVATQLEPMDIPGHVLSSYGKVRPVTLDQEEGGRKFSLAGVQMKLSMKEREGRYNLGVEDELGDWIIKTPSTVHPNVPVNEFTAMSLAAMVGVEIPEMRLVELDRLDGLPQLNIPAEKYAFAIKRFDRVDQQRIHMEDFAQVLVKYPQEKYRGANYAQIGRVLYQYSGDGLADVQQLARRLLVNILLANGDAHLKNWSLLYQDQITPRLSPAYDIVTTRVYIEEERQFALNLGKTKAWYEVTLAHFEHWARKADIPWRAIKPHLEEVMERARTKWPEVLRELPMVNEQKSLLVDHWASLQPDFRLKL
tara:strand:- start:6777 stop:8045 length:1269 start_codon:yes stop_codon:yes gene_type:complete